MATTAASAATVSFFTAMMALKAAHPGVSKNPTRAFCETG
jgi:hypothetical protein